MAVKERSCDDNWSLENRYGRRGTEMSHRSEFPAASFTLVEVRGLVRVSGTSHSGLGSPSTPAPLICALRLFPPIVSMSFQPARGDSHVTLFTQRSSEEN
jgi:hypothetical protein